MKQFAILLLLVTPLLSIAQKTNNGTIDISGTQGITFFRFSDDKLISQNRRNETGTATLNSYMVQYCWAPNNKNYYIKTGIGITNHFMLARRGLTLFTNPRFTWVSDDGATSFFLQKVTLKNKNVTLPISAGYKVQLSKTNKNYVALFGLQFNNNFLINSSSTITVDSTGGLPNAKQMQAIKDSYENRAAQYILSIQPVADFRIPLNNNVQINLMAMPLTFYTKSWYTNFSNGPIAATFSIGINYKL